MYKNIFMGLVAALLSMSFAANAQQYFTATPLGTLGGTSSIGYGINASGKVAGSSNTGSATDAFVTNAVTNAMTDLGTLGGTSSIGYGINASGQVTGTSNTGSAQHVFVTNAVTNAMTDLGTLGGPYSFGYSINASGQVTGMSNTAGNATHAFVTNAATNAMTDLGTLGGTISVGQSINASGQVTGTSNTAGDAAQHAFFTNAATNAMTDLGTLGGTTSWGYGINASGQVTGASNTASNAQHAFVTNAATNAMADLGTLGGTSSIGYGINASGQVTGTSNTASGAGHAFLYSNGQMLDLNSLLSPAAASLYTITAGTGINDSGQIAAYGVVNATGLIVAFLLTPPAPPPAPTALTATAGNGQVALSWTASMGATSYNLYEATSAGGSLTPVATGITGTSATIIGLTNGTKYYFTVAAVNAGVSGAQSAETPAVVPGASVAVPAMPTWATLLMAGWLAVLALWRRHTSMAAGRV